jgi:TetR/AcrR family transcriptional repressor of nem operon
MRYNLIRQQIFKGIDMATQSALTSVERILKAATGIAQAHGYGGLNLRALAEQVGIKAASLYHHFPSKADLAAAVARRYAEDSAVVLTTLGTEAGAPELALRRYPETFRRSLENDNRMCLCSFMAAEFDDLPAGVQKEIQAFADVNVAWLASMLEAQGKVDAGQAQVRASAIFAAVSGAQLMARGRADIALFDALIDNYRAAGLFAI